MHGFDGLKNLRIIHFALQRNVVVQRGAEPGGVPELDDGFCGEASEVVEQPFIPGVLLHVLAPERRGEVCLEQERDSRLLPSWQIAIHRLTLCLCGSSWC